jgi:hypothetical protein
VDAAKKFPAGMTVSEYQRRPHFFAFRFEPDCVAARRIAAQGHATTRRNA